MKSFVSSILYLLATLTLSAQNQSFLLSELPAMPEPVANNAVVSAMCGDTLCVYSFCGIDETKTPAGIHLKAWRYNTETQLWTQLPDVPDDTGNGKIAAGASVVNNKIYVIGGYYVEDNFSELSSDDVHIFNPESNQWEADGSTIPVPIDDHVQAVWNESLIYIVTGWSDNGNVADVQIYNPEENTWIAGTPTPNNTDYKVFGGSGEIFGNTIIYHGGVKGGFSFNPTSEVRKGTINPLNPSEIEWELVGESELGTAYRAGALNMPSANAIFWIGGSELGYNFNGIDYNGTGGVAPADRIIYHNPFTSEIMNSAEVINSENLTIPMDLRGVARLSSLETESSTGIHESIICGGMLEDQQVTDQVILISSDNALNIQADKHSTIRWNLANAQLNISAEQLISKVEIFDMAGRSALQRLTNSERASIPLNDLSRGIYVVSVIGDSNKSFNFKIQI